MATTAVKSNVKQTATAEKTKVKEAATKQIPAGKTTTEKTTQLSEQVLEEIKRGQQSAIEAVRSFTESVDKSLHGEDQSKRQEVIDAALEMSKKLVQTQYDFLRSVVHSAGETLGASGRKK
jgi:vacuolar-type H+-ATPase subunit E/Vma4